MRGQRLLFAAAVWSCTDPRWVSEPLMRDGRFVAEQATDCRIEGSGLELAKLRSHFVKALADAGARAEKAGQQWEVTRHRIDDGDEVSIREQVRVEWYGAKSLGYDSESREIEGSGNNSHLRRVAYAARFESRSPRLVHVTMRTLIEIERPWYAPTVIFVKIARSKTREKFEQRAHELAEEYSAALR